MLEMHTDTPYSTRNLTTVDGLRIHVRCWLPDSPPTFVVVIAHGLGGHGGYYADSLVPHLEAWGAAVYAPDFRGHGLSEGGRGDIKRCGLFLHDLDTVLRVVRVTHLGLPLFVLGESMGTPIAVNYCAVYPNAVRLHGIILASCLVAPHMKPQPAEVIRTLRYAITGFCQPAIPLAERADLCIRNPALIIAMHDDPLYNRHISPRFVAVLALHMWRARKLARRLNVPVLILQGERDAIINWRKTRAFFANIGSHDKTLHIFPDAYHAVLHDPATPLVHIAMRAWLMGRSESLCNIH